MKKLRSSFLAAVATYSLGWSHIASAYDYADAYQGYLNFMSYIVDSCYPYSWDPNGAYEACIMNGRIDAANWCTYLHQQALQLGDWEAAIFFSQVAELLWVGGSS